MKPDRIFLACDGPNPNRPGEDALVLATREAMERSVTWECRIERRYAERNQGCRAGVRSAIDWFFEQVDEGIILEDDCVPHPDFFPYCAHLLNRNRDNPTVMHISGDNSTSVDWQGDDSYRFVRWSSS